MLNMCEYVCVLIQGDDKESWNTETYREGEKCSEDKKAMVPTPCHMAIFPLFPLKFD